MSLRGVLLRYMLSDGLKTPRARLEIRLRLSLGSRSPMVLTSVWCLFYSVPGCYQMLPKGGCGESRFR